MPAYNEACVDDCFCKSCVRKFLARWRALELALEQVLFYTLSLVGPKISDKTILCILMEIT